MALMDRRLATCVSVFGSDGEGIELHSRMVGMGVEDGKGV